MNILQAIILAVVEGITEFLPISSTAHLVLFTDLLSIETTEFVKLFVIAIQLGAILSVVALYFKKFVNFRDPKFYPRLIIATLPALVVGYLFSDVISNFLEKPEVIASILIIGGLVLIISDRIKTHPETSTSNISYAQALRIGLFQTIAIILPGSSRSAASIIGGRLSGLNIKTATEFSFLIAVPAMFAATGYSVLKYVSDYGSFDPQQIKLLAIGNLVSFLVALIAISSFIKLVSKYGLKPWGYYRVAIGGLYLLIYVIL